MLEIWRSKTSILLPKHARTLLRTNRAPKSIANIAGGRYWYKGIGNCLHQKFRNIKLASNTVLSLNISIDGLPLHKSGRTTFWPILMNVDAMRHIKPMTVAIFCGDKKPTSVEQYLRPLVDEINMLYKDGIMLGSESTQTYIKIRAFIADSPARAFIK
uniref:Uncharacterized protein n=1 Tax=Anopheles epiroticus TaxID=199890 RepID=A0A182PWV6_9DIPT